jgi:hypothetical protein
MSESQGSEFQGPFAALTDVALEAWLRRALRITLIFGLLAALVLWKASGWRNAAMMATGAVISGASIFEWLRLIRLINAKLDNKQVPKGAALAFVFFLLRLTLFGAAIYGSLRCFHGSVVALLCGLGLAILAIVWEALRLLRN